MISSFQVASLVENVFTKNSQTQYPIFLWLHHSIRWKYSRFLMHHFTYISEKFSQTFLVPFANLKILNKALLD